MNKSRFYLFLTGLAFIGFLVQEVRAEEAFPQDVQTSSSPEQTRFNHHEVWFGRWLESGVSNRLLTDYFGTFRMNSTFSIEVGASLSLLEQVGPSMLGFLGKFSFPESESQLVLGIQHERWPTWQVTENRLEFYWQFFPNDKFNISFGLAYRTPQYGVATVFPFSNWSIVPNGELSILYAADWHLFRVEPMGLSVMIWNFDHMRLFTMDNVHFALKVDWTATSSLKVFLSGTAGLSGISGGIVSGNQSILSLGLVYEL